MPSGKSIFWNVSLISPSEKYHYSILLYLNIFLILVFICLKTLALNYRPYWEDPIETLRKVQPFQKMYMDTIDRNFGWSHESLWNMHSVHTDLSFLRITHTRLVIFIKFPEHLVSFKTMLQILWLKTKIIWCIRKIPMFWSFKWELWE